MKKAIMREMSKTLYNGAAATLQGLLSFGCLLGGMYGLIKIPETNGYWAVLLFIGSAVAVLAAFAIMFFEGVWIGKQGKATK